MLREVPHSRPKSIQPLFFNSFKILQNKSVLKFLLNTRQFVYLRSNHSSTPVQARTGGAGWNFGF